MEELVVASRNKGKIKEIKCLLPAVKLLSLDDIGFTEEIPEPFDTFKENAFAKASTIHRFCGKDTLADDSGLCVQALNGAPGVHSAYFGGLPSSDKKNREKLIAVLQGVENRSAFFTTILCLIRKGRETFFEGVCYGSISQQERGSNGFGYDSVFIPQGYTHTFGELESEVKQLVSHRASALKQLVCAFEKKPST